MAQTTRLFYDKQVFAASVKRGNNFNIKHGEDNALKKSLTEKWLKNAAVAVLLLALGLPQTACNLGGSSGSDVKTTSGARHEPHFKTGINLFSTDQDVEMGKRSAQQILHEMPLVRDEKIQAYVRGIGEKLVAKAPGHPFKYQFYTVATKDVNAFALPGGFVFVFAGAIAAAKNEGELAGVMAHEISHVALRHGTNQATKAYLAQAGLDILSGLAGGGDPNTEDALRKIGGAGANALFLKFGRTAETQADVEGAHIMADAGYDPRDMIGFFATLAKQGGQRTPEFMSDHPDPGNRAERLNQELKNLQVSANATRDTNEFKQVKAALTGSRAALGDYNEQRVGPGDPNNIPAGARPAPPATSFNQYTARDGSFTVQFPANWDGLVATDDANLIFAPKGAYGQVDQAVVVTHGIFIGAVPPQGQDLARASAAFVEQQLSVNRDFRVVRQPQAVNFGGRQGYATVVAGPSTVTGVMEVDVIYTTATNNGRLFYLITMAPENEIQAYQPTFDQIVANVRVGG